MTATDSVFQRALSNLLTEIFDGPPGQEAYVLNPGDPGLLRQLDTLDASAASTRPMPGKTTIAAHADHVLFGLAILNRWAAGGSQSVGWRRVERQLATARCQNENVLITRRLSSRLHFDTERAELQERSAGG
jgi:hypothetical protein